MVVFVLFEYAGTAGFKVSALNFFPSYFVTVFSCTFCFIMIFCTAAATGINMTVIIF